MDKRRVPGCTASQSINLGDFKYCCSWDMIFSAIILLYAPCLFSIIKTLITCDTNVIGDCTSAQPLARVGGTARNDASFLNLALQSRI